MEEPDEGWSKVNADGALSKKEELGENHSDFVVGSCHFFLVTADSETVELLACRKAIALAHEFNIPKVIVDMDSQVAVIKILSENIYFC
jgi:hypothetical protein